jgi:hypothetical protein
VNVKKSGRGRGVIGDSEEEEESSPNNRFHRTANPRHASCLRTWRATGSRTVRRR